MAWYWISLLVQSMYIKFKVCKYIYLCHLPYPTPVRTLGLFILCLLKLLETLFYIMASISGEGGLDWQLFLGLCYWFNLPNW